MASPIEAMLLNALLSTNDERFGFWYGDRFYGSDRGSPCDIHAGVAVGQYRVDFLLTVNGNETYRLAVECDGHDFHDRAKQQAAYDRARDRDLLARGVFTIRFTGSEIHHSPERCVRDVVRCLAVVHTITMLFLDGWHHGFERGQQSILNPQPPRGEL